MNQSERKSFLIYQTTDSYELKICSLSNSSVVPKITEIMDSRMRKPPKMTLEEQMDLEDMRTQLQLDYLVNQGCSIGDDQFPERPFITTLSSIGQPIEPSSSFVYYYQHETMSEEEFFETVERMVIEPIYEDQLDNEDDVKDQDEGDHDNVQDKDHGEGHDEIHDNGHNASYDKVPDKDHDNDSDNSDEEVEIVAEIIYDHGYKYFVDKNDQIIGAEMVKGDEDEDDLIDYAPVPNTPSTRGPMKLGPWDEQLRQYARVEEGMNYEEVLETIETVLDEKKKKNKKNTTKKRGSIATAHADIPSKKIKKQ